VYKYRQIISGRHFGRNSGLPVYRNTDTEYEYGILEYEYRIRIRLPLDCKSTRKALGYLTNHISNQKVVENHRIRFSHTWASKDAHHLSVRITSPSVLVAKLEGRLRIFVRLCCGTSVSYTCVFCIRMCIFRILYTEYESVCGRRCIQ